MKSQTFKSQTFNDSSADLFRPASRKKLHSRVLSSSRLEFLKKEIETDDHLIPLDELYARYDTDPVIGLNNDTAAARLAYDGPNELTPSNRDAWYRILIEAMFGGFNILIIIGSILCILAYILDPGKDITNIYLAVILISVVLITGLYSFVQTYRSAKIMKAFQNMIPPTTTCIRSGEILPAIMVKQIVKGDIVLVRAGEVVPADIRVIESRGFKVDNSSLTGESVAVMRSCSEGVPNILESTNVAFFSTMCVEGSATGIVICTGDLTALGRVAGLAARLKPKPSHLFVEIKRFILIITAWAFTLALTLAICCYCLGFGAVEALVYFIGIIVANVPEGLQPTITAALNLSARTLAKKNCLVKKLESVEALGACNTICSDKTGTLTLNVMKVKHVWIYNEAFKVVDGVVSEAASKQKAFTELKICAVLCSNVKVLLDGSITGDATEKAIFNFFSNKDLMSEMRKKYPLVADIPFNSTNKYQVTIHVDQTASANVVMMKGAPEALITRCSTMIHGDRVTNVTDEVIKCLENAINSLAAKGERVLAYADLQLDTKAFPLGFEFDTTNVNFPLDKYRFLGLTGLIDPPKKEVLAAIQTVRAAGVRVFMVTGDHPLTARAIAGEVGIATNNDAAVVTGNDLREMSNDNLINIINTHQEIVFARTSPTQKLQIVEACQSRGDVVAVTGDGVNDSPALRKADIGISMGITGSQVSKQTADIVLMDDNFATIVLGIEEGRRIFENLKKTICYILASNVPEILPVFLFVIMAIPMPIGVMSIIAIDLGTDLWPAVALSMEKAESNVMNVPPRSKESTLVSFQMFYLAYFQFGVIETAAGMFSYFVVMAAHGFHPSRLVGIRTSWYDEGQNALKDSNGDEWTYHLRELLLRQVNASYFTAIVMSQIVNAIICKSTWNSVVTQGMSNTCLLVGFVFEIILVGIICYVPGVDVFFSLAPMKAYMWFLALPFTCYLFIFDELRKLCVRRSWLWYRDWTYY